MKRWRVIGFPERRRVVCVGTCWTDQDEIDRRIRKIGENVSVFAVSDGSFHDNTISIFARPRRKPGRNIRNIERWIAPMREINIQRINASRNGTGF